MANEPQTSTAWFESMSPKVDGFEPTECPHGFLRFEMEHNRTDSSYRCTECNTLFIAKNQDKLDEE